MGLIIIASALCTIGVISGVEFIRYLLQQKQFQKKATASGFKQNKHMFLMALAVLWTAIWVIVSLAGIYEFFTNSEAYFHRNS